MHNNSRHRTGTAAWSNCDATTCEASACVKRVPTGQPHIWGCVYSRDHDFTLKLLQKHVPQSSECRQRSLGQQHEAHRHPKQYQLFVGLKTIAFHTNRGYWGVVAVGHARVHNRRALKFESQPDMLSVLQRMQQAASHC